MEGGGDGKLKKGFTANQRDRMGNRVDMPVIHRIRILKLSRSCAVH